MDDPRSKRKRLSTKLSQCLADKSVSCQSILRIMREVGIDGDRPVTKYEMDKMYGERLRHVIHKEPLIDVKGNPMRWNFCEPGKLLQYMVETCPRLMEIYAEAANMHRGEWSCIVTFDEMVPGDKLKSNNHRKSMSLCFSFVELGRRFLVIPCVWIFPVFVRASLYNAVEGGWSNFLRIYLQRQFLGANALSTSGVPLMLFGQPFLLTAKLVHLLSDGDGLRSALNWKGAQSLRCCWYHWNCIKRGSTVVEHSAELVDITCTDHTRFKLQTDAQLDDAIALVEAAAKRYAADAMTKELYNNICMSKGLNYNKHGVLFDPKVRKMVAPPIKNLNPKP